MEDICDFHILLPLSLFFLSVGEGRMAGLWNCYHQPKIVGGQRRVQPCISGHSIKTFSSGLGPVLGGNLVSHYSWVITWCLLPSFSNSLIQLTLDITDDMGMGLSLYPKILYNGGYVISDGNTEQIHYIPKFDRYDYEETVAMHPLPTTTTFWLSCEAMGFSQTHLSIPAAALLLWHSTWSCCDNMLWDDAFAIMDKNLLQRGFIWSDFLSVISAIQYIKIRYIECLLYFFYLYSNTQLR